MVKTDVKSAFRIIPIHPNDYPLLGMKWENLYYFDRCLPMGCSSSCAIFEAFSTALEWLALHRLGASGVLHILDDFLFIAESEEKCQADLQFASITLDTVKQEARLPDDISSKIVAGYYKIPISVAKSHFKKCSPYMVS